MADRFTPLVRRFWLVGALAVTACVPALHQDGRREVDLNLPGQFAPGAAEAPIDALAVDPLFDDPNLAALIDEALAHNQELGIAAQEINVENAEILVRRGKVLPFFDVGVDPEVEKVGRYTSQGASDEADDITEGKKVPVNLANYAVELHASWEIDVWKRLRNQTRAARERYLASVEGRNFLVTGLVAEVAHDYYELVALDRQLAVFDSNLAILGEALESTKLQLQAAKVTVLAVQRFEAEIAKNQARRFEIAQAIVERENHLNALVGRYPQPIARSADNFLSASLGAPRPGVPAQWIQRRPDILAAERRLSAAKLDVKAARAAFYPSLSIDARFGLEAFTPATFVAFPESMLYTMAAHALGPVVNRTELTSEYRASDAKQMAAVLSYEQTVLLAFVDVANQLAAIHNADEGYARRLRQVEQLRAAVQTSNQLFASARADYLEVLTTRSESLEAELDQVETRQRQIAARIDLYRALGGGWTRP